MARKPPPPDPRAVRRDERRLVGIAAKPVSRPSVGGTPTQRPSTKSPSRGGRK